VAKIIFFVNEFAKTFYGYFYYPSLKGAGESAPAFRKTIYQKDSDPNSIKNF